MNALVPVRTADPSALFERAEVKRHLRVDFNDDDTLIDAITAAAVERFDGYAGQLGACLMTQTWKAYFRDFGFSVFRLPLGPVASITSVKYYDASNVEQTFGSSNYVLLTDHISPYVALASSSGSWPSPLYSRDDAINVIFVAGFASAAAVPTPIKQMILLTIGHWYENREGVVVGNLNAMPLPDAVQSLLMQYRRGSF